MDILFKNYHPTFSNHDLAHQLVVMHLFHEAQTTFSPRLSEVATHHTHGIHDDAIFIIRKACLTQQGMITLAKSQDVDIQLTHLMDLMDLMDQFCLVPALGPKE